MVSAGSRFFPYAGMLPPLVEHGARADPRLAGRRPRPGQARACRRTRVVGVVAAKLGQVVLTWLSGPWVARLQMGTALLIIAVGIVLTTSAWRLVHALT